MVTLALEHSSTLLPSMRQTDLTEAFRRVMKVESIAMKKGKPSSSNAVKSVKKDNLKKKQQPSLVSSFNCISLMSPIQFEH